MAAQEIVNGKGGAPVRLSNLFPSQLSHNFIPLSLPQTQFTGKDSKGRAIMAETQAKPSELKTPKMAGVVRNRSLIDMAVKGEDGVPVCTLVKLVKFAYGVTDLLHLRSPRNRFPKTKLAKELKEKKQLLEEF